MTGRWLGTVWARWSVAVLATCAAAVLGASAAPAATNSGQASPSLAAYSASYGFLGHAGLYGYGLGFDPKNQRILVGDVWNYRVQLFDESGNHVQNIAHGAPMGALGGIGAPFGVAGDPDGNVWVADQPNHRIVEFDDTGTWIQTIGLGGGPNAGENYPVGCGGGMMYFPTSLVIDPVSRDIFVTDVTCRNVWVYSNTGVFIRQFAWTIPGRPLPRGIGLDSANPPNVYVAAFNNLVYVFDENGSLQRSFPPAPHPSDMGDPRGLTVDNVNQRVYVVGAQNQKVVVFSTNGSYIATWSSAGATPFNSIRFVTTDQAGDVYVSDLYGYAVYKFDNNGNVLPWATAAQPPPNGGWNRLDGVATDPVNGNVYGVDSFANRIQYFATTGGQSCPSAKSCAAFVGAFGQRGPLNPNTPSLDYPHVVAVDHNANAVFIDGTNSVLRFTLNGQFVAGWGVRGRGVGQFWNGPQGMRVVPSGNGTGTLYTVDAGTCRIQVFDYTGKVLSYMGSCGTGTDQMRAPTALEVDPVRNVAYVADVGNNRVVMWDLTTQHIIASFSGPVGGQQVRPRGVAIDPSRTWLYIGDTANNRIVRVSAADLSSGAVAVTTGADTPQGHFKGPQWMQFGAFDGRLYVSDNSQIIYAFRITG
jgi:DNA-binding beta-propeller fold protein YncE